MVLKLYWYKDEPNFGDALSPVILQKLLNVEIEWTDIVSADVISIGSILHSAIVSGKHIKVFGSGLLNPYSYYRGDVRHLDLLAVRGPITRSCIEKYSEVYGEPGLLVRKFYSDYIGLDSIYNGVLVLHHTQTIHETEVQNLELQGWRVLSCATDDIDSFINIIKTRIV